MSAVRPSGGDNWRCTLGNVNIRGCVSDALCRRRAERLESITDPRAERSYLRWCSMCKRLVSVGADPFA